MAPTPTPKHSHPAALLACILLTLYICCSATRTPSVVSPSATAKLSELAAAASILGFSPYIQPTYQENYVSIFYPQSWSADPQDRVSYKATTEIWFQCLQPTRRIVLNINPLWENSTQIGVIMIEDDWSYKPLTVKETRFNAADETVIVDVIESMGPNATYRMTLESGNHVIDQDDRFGIQAFRRSDQDTGEELITIGLSPEPTSIRRFVPCFDAPFYQISFTWSVTVNYGIYPPAFANMNDPSGQTPYHGCFANNRTASRSAYHYTLDRMTAEATVFRVVPFEWYHVSENMPAPDCEQEQMQS